MAASVGAGSLLAVTLILFILVVDTYAALWTESQKVLDLDPDSLLLLSANSADRDTPLVVFALDSSDLELTQIDQYGTESDVILGSVSVDNTNDVVYAHDATFNRILAFGDTYFEAVHIGVTSSNVMLSVDWLSHNVYWVDAMLRTVSMAPGSVPGKDPSLMYKVVISTGMQRPRGIAIDPKEGYMFISDSGNFPRLERSTLIGSQRTPIVYRGILQPISMCIDTKSKRIYWLDEARDTIESAGYSGEQRQVLRRYSGSEFMDIALYHNTVIALMSVLSTTEIYFLHKDTGEELRKPVKEKSYSILGLAVHQSRAETRDNDPCLLKKCSDICVIMDNTASCLCQEGYVLKADGRSCKDVSSVLRNSRAIVFSNGSSLCSQDVRSVATFQFFPPHCFYKLPRQQASDGIQLVVTMPKSNIIVFTTTHTLSFLSLTHPISVQRLISTTATITGLALDWISQTVYWTKYGGGEGTIHTVTFNGDSRSAGVCLETDLFLPREILALPLERMLVWVSGFPLEVRIEKASLNCSHRKTLVSSMYLTDPRALAFDQDSRKVYWMDSVFINSVGLDGSNAVRVATVDDSAARLFFYKAFYMWTETNWKQTATELKVRHTSTKTTKRGTFQDVGMVTAVTVWDPDVQPDSPGPCDVENGGCDQICVRRGDKRSCDCDLGYILDRNGKTCSSRPASSHFMLFADYTHSKIYQLSLRTRQLQAIVAAPHVCDVLYNPVTGTILYVQAESGKALAIQSVSLNGLKQRTYSREDVTLTHADRIAVDPTSGNIYYTSTLPVGIQQTTKAIGVGVFSPEGKHRQLVSAGRSPRDIVLAPHEGYVFWTDHSQPAFIARANMDGSDSLTIVSSARTNMVWPNGLTADYKGRELYWTDGFLDIISAADFDGKNQREIIADKGAHLMDIEVDDFYLYYTSWNRPHISKINKTGEGERHLLAENAELGRIDSMSLYQSDIPATPVNPDCQPRGGKGDCSTFCFPTPTGHVCACQDGVALKADGKTCEDVIQCPATVTNGNVDPKCPRYDGLTCSVTCNDGYKSARPSGQLTCNHGFWDNVDICQAILCPRLIIPNGNLSPKCERMAGEACAFTCIEGYKRNPTITSLACKGDGDWNQDFASLCIVLPEDEVLPTKGKQQQEEYLQIDMQTVNAFLRVCVILILLALTVLVWRSRTPRPHTD